MYNKKQKFKDLVSQTQILSAVQHEDNSIDLELQNSDGTTNKVKMKYVPGEYQNHVHTYGGGGSGYSSGGSNSAIGTWHSGYGSGGFIGGNDQISIYPQNGAQYVPNQPYQIVTTGGTWEPYNKPVSDQLEELQKKISKLEKVPNKVDKDLINTNIPYNIKKDLFLNLYYSFSVTGYDVNQISLLIKKDGFLLKLKKRDDKDDLIGEEFEFICRGIKGNNQEIPIYIDVDEYDINSSTCELENGLLNIFIPKSKKVNSEIKINRKIHKKEIITTEKEDELFS